MSAELPSTLQLVDAPELAALHVLEAALATVERALIASYPELEEGLCLSQPTPLSTEAWLADAIIVTSRASRPRSSTTDSNSRRAVCSGHPTSDARIEGRISSPPSMMATRAVAPTAPP
jgi:hypothetical protein